MPLPYQGRPGQRDLASPTLIPQFYQGVAQANGGGNNLNSSAINYKSPAQFKNDYGRVAASVQATIGGTVATGDKITLTLTHPQLPGGSLSASYTTVASDTLTTFAEELAAALNAVFKTNGLLGLIDAEATEETVTVNWDGPLGNFAVLGRTVNTGAETVTFNPVGGGLTGGSGPVFIANNFEFSWRGSSLAYYYGQANISISGSLLQAMVTADMPIV